MDGFCHSQNPVRARRGFTLMELLVVLAIIAVLASIFLPVLQQVGATGRKTTCLSNLRQIGSAINLYAADNNNTYPYSYWVPPTGFYNTWDRLIGPYLGSPNAQKAGSAATLETQKIMYCPADYKPDAQSLPRRSYSMVWGTIGVNTNAQPDAPPAVRAVQVASPARTLSVVELSSVAALGDGSDNKVWSSANSVIYYPSTQLAKKLGPNLHGGRFNYLFLDGHCETLLPQDTVGTGTLANPKGMWTLDPND